MAVQSQYPMAEPGLTAPFNRCLNDAAHARAPNRLLRIRPGDGCDGCEHSCQLEALRQQTGVASPGQGGADSESQSRACEGQSDPCSQHVVVVVRRDADCAKPTYFVCRFDVLGRKRAGWGHLLLGAGVLRLRRINGVANSIRWPCRIIVWRVGIRVDGHRCAESGGLVHVQDQPLFVRPHDERLADLTQRDDGARPSAKLDVACNQDHLVLSHLDHGADRCSWVGFEAHRSVEGCHDVILVGGVNFGELRTRGDSCRRGAHPAVRGLALPGCSS